MARSARPGRADAAAMRSPPISSPYGGWRSMPCTSPIMLGSSMFRGQTASLMPWKGRENSVWPRSSAASMRRCASAIWGGGRSSRTIASGPPPPRWSICAPRAASAGSKLPRKCSTSSTPHVPMQIITMRHDCQASQPAVSKVSTAAPSSPGCCALARLGRFDGRGTPGALIISGRERQGGRHGRAGAGDLPVSI